MLTRSLRSALIDVQTTTYVDFARAKGLDRRTVLLHHVLRAALLPIVTLIGVRLSYAIGGSVVVETVFALPGLGSWMVESILARDYMVVQTLTLAFALGAMLINLAHRPRLPACSTRASGWAMSHRRRDHRGRRLAVATPARVRRRSGLAAGGCMLGFLVLVALVGPHVSPYDPNAHDFDRLLQAAEPSRTPSAPTTSGATS